MRQPIEVPIADVLDVVIDHRGLTPKKLGADWASCGVQVISAMNIKEGQLDTFITQRYVTPNVFERWMPEKLRRGDILMTSEAPLGAVAVFEEEGNFCLGQRLFALRAKPSKLDQQYFFWVLQAPLVQNRFVARSTGTTAKGIRQSELLQVHIPLPPLEEQRRIAAILDKADAVRRKRKEVIALTEELLRSAFLEMFGDPVTNPKGWEVKQLEEITSHITDGVHFRPTYTKSGIPFISVKDITTGRLLFEDCKFISEEDHLKFTKRCKPELGDILYTKVGATYGRPALVDVSDDFSLYVSVCLIKPLRNIVRPQFLKQIMATPALKRQADRSIKGIGVPDLHLNMIKKFVVPVPNLDIQDEFLKKTEKIQKCLSVSESSLTKLDDLFSSLLQRAFRGEL